MKNLLGLWMCDPETRPNQLVTIEFRENSELIYTIMDGETDHVMLLTYRIEDNTLITDQPSAPRKEKTGFSITPEGKLILLYGNQTHQYIRVPDMNTE